MLQLPRSSDDGQTVIHARRWRLSGRVQGVGFRPTVHRCALEFGVVGWVCNRGGELEIHAEASTAQLELFERALKLGGPAAALVTDFIEVTAHLEGFAKFSIEASISEQASSHFPPLDLCICDDCLAEMNNVDARRYRYPFINCTQCGPRYTLIQALPYDRETTTMSEFQMCPECLSEYVNPSDRRYHAQPLACAKCGPALNWQRSGGPAEVSQGNEVALQAALSALRQGMSVAARGIGGYHLLCSATSGSAIAALRRAKHRPSKPFAVLLPLDGIDGLDGVRRVAELSVDEGMALRQSARPIVLLRRSTHSEIDAGVAPGLAEIGVMLPYSPMLQLLSTEFGGPLVTTSGNISGEPILSTIAEAEHHLGGVAFGFLHHNRAIRRIADDSVIRFIAGASRPIRLGRGSTPLEMNLTRPVVVPTIALGSLQKNTIALAWGRRIAISPHIGDLTSVGGYDTMLKTVVDFQALYGVAAEQLVHDAHPGVHARQLGQALKLPTVAAWHHFAHASAVAGEYLHDEPMLCFTWDGNGFGPDRTLWGGEALLGCPSAWKRVASFRCFPLLGGESAVRQPWRVALGLSWRSGHSWSKERTFNAALLRSAYLHQINCPETSAVGRLFDAAAALLGLCVTTTYAAEAAILLESVCPRQINLDAAVRLPLSCDAAGILRTDWEPLLALLLDESQSVVARAEAFHSSLALALCEQARAVRTRTGVGVVGLTGGVFQNRRLTELVEQQLNRDGFRILIPQRLPVNDAAISFGQIIEASGAARRQPSSLVTKHNMMIA